MGYFKTIAIEQQKPLNELLKISEAEKCGLIFTGKYEDGRPQFLGDNKAWARYNDSDF